MFEVSRFGRSSCTTKQDVVRTCTCPVQQPQPWECSNESTCRSERSSLVFSRRFCSTTLCFSFLYCSSPETNKVIQLGSTQANQCAGARREVRRRKKRMAQNLKGGSTGCRMARPLAALLIVAIAICFAVTLLRRAARTTGKCVMKRPQLYSLREASKRVPTNARATGSAGRCQGWIELFTQQRAVNN